MAAQPRRGILDLLSLQNRLPRGGMDCHLLCAVSGGADSVAMLLALSQWASHKGASLEVIHVNHRIRASSQTDAEWVRQLCDRLQIPCSVEALEPLSSFSESTLRELRYAAFQRACIRAKSPYLLLAHNADDLVETFLMHLFRGTGLNGLTFLFQQDQSGMIFFRPLWRTNRSEILRFLAEQKQSYLVDETNADTHYSRNRVRQNLIPMLEQQYNPRVRESVYRAAIAISACGQLVDSAVNILLRRVYRRFYGTRILPLHWLRRQDSGLREAVLVQWLKDNGSGKTQLVDAAIRGISAAINNRRSEFRRIDDAGGAVLTERVLWYHQRQDESDQSLATEHDLLFSYPLTARLDKPVILTSASPLQITSLGGREVHLRLQVSPQNHMVLRNRLPADTLVNGASLKKTLINDKVPWYLRNHLLLVANERDEIVHVVGIRRMNGRLKSLNLVAIND